MKGTGLKIEARRVKIDPNKPSGIKYALTLHDSKGKRIIGYDNAHQIPHLSSKLPHDHLHKEGKIRPYDYKDAGSLLEDFWKNVERILKERK